MKIERMMKSSLVVCHDASVLLSTLAPADYSSKKYLLKNGATSSETVYNQEKGVFVTPSLVMNVHISRTRMTAHQAKLFYQLVSAATPSMFQVFLLNLNSDRVEKLLSDIGIHADFESPLDDVWYGEALKDASVDEKRYVVTFLPQEGFKELSCECLRHYHLKEDKNNLCRVLLLDRKALILQLSYKSVIGVINEFRPAAFKLVGSWNDFDLLVVEPFDENESQWLFFRSRNTLLICYYIINNSYESLDFLSEELFVHDGGVYQAANDSVVRIHTLNKCEWANYSNEKLSLGRNVAYCGDMPPEYVDFFYVKGADGLFTVPVE